jgi:4a-hydroxytetrahydrobiopterin dehydratase
MQPLTQNELEQQLKKIDGWQIERGELTRSYKFEDFVSALRFVNRVGELAEQAGHHPDIDIRYNRVRLGLCTHDAGGITAKDFDLAARADAASA